MIYFPPTVALRCKPTVEVNSDRTVPHLVSVVGLPEMQQCRPEPLDITVVDPFLQACAVIFFIVIMNSAGSMFCYFKSKKHAWLQKGHFKL